MVQIGTVSRGTLREDDLLECFSDELRGLLRRCRDAELRKDVRNWLDAVGTILDEDKPEMVCDGGDLLDRFAPPYMYFGTLEGDASDFGFWPDIEALDEAADEEDGVVKVSAGDAWPSGLRAAGIDFVAEVSDHGNVSLRRACNGQTVWSCV